MSSGPGLVSPGERGARSHTEGEYAGDGAADLARLAGVGVAERGGLGVAESVGEIDTASLPSNGQPERLSEDSMGGAVAVAGVGMGSVPVAASEDGVGGGGGLATRKVAVRGWDASNDGEEDSSGFSHDNTSQMGSSAMRSQREASAPIPIARGTPYRASVEVDFAADPDERDAFSTTPLGVLIHARSFGEDDYPSSLGFGHA